MICSKCNVKVSVTDSKCPKCGHDLLQFGGAVFYEDKGKDSGRYGQGVKDMVFGGLQSAWKEDFSTLDPDKRKIYSPLANKLKAFFQRHISEGALEDFFDREVLPLVDDLSKDKDNAELFHKVESAIKENLGSAIYDHYKSKGEDVLRILRAGEIANMLIDKKAGDIDLSVKMFPYFKASEKSCWIHTKKRYRALKDNPLIEEISEWFGKNYDNIYIEEIPKWLADRKKTLIEVMNGIITENDYYVGGSLRTGIAIYVLGRTWRMKGRRSDLSQEKTFQINNILRTGGTNSEKELLAENLQELQVLRNERMHKDVEGDENAVTQSWWKSYVCLRGIAGVLTI